jgi:uncharacterized membrane protein
LLCHQIYKEHFIKEKTKEAVAIVVAVVAVVAVIAVVTEISRNKNGKFLKLGSFILSDNEFRFRFRTFSQNANLGL